MPIITNLFPDIFLVSRQKIIQKFCAALCLGLAFNLLMITQNTSAFTPRLSVSIDQTQISNIDGTDIIFGSNLDRSSSVPFSINVNTNNRTGYKVFISAKDENTALKSGGLRINSIGQSESLNNFQDNEWGISALGTTGSYLPVSPASNPYKLKESDTHAKQGDNIDLSVGLKLSGTLEPGIYQNQLVVSVITNPLDNITRLAPGPNIQAAMSELTNGHLEEVTSVKWQGPASLPTLTPAKPTYEDFGYKNVSLDDTYDPIYLYYDQVAKSMIFQSTPAVIDVYLNKNSSEMFNNLPMMTSIDLSHFDSREVETLADFLMNAERLASVDVSHFDVRKVKDFQGMFYSNSSLTSLDLTSFHTDSATNFYQMFFLCSQVSDLKIPNFKTGKVTRFESMFGSMDALESLNLTHFDVSSGENFDFMFAGNAAMTNLNISNWYTPKAKDMNSMFYMMYALPHLDISHFDTSNVTNMDSMFYEMNALEELNVSHFRTSNVTKMGSMFYNVSNVRDLDVSNFDTSNVEDMQAMFYGMESVEHLNLSNFDTRKVKNMTRMFRSINAISELDLSNFDTRNVTLMRSMFNDNKKLSKIIFSKKFDTSNVVDMQYMFGSMCAYKELDLTTANFKTSKVGHFDFMFENTRCTAPVLEKIYVEEDFDITATTDPSVAFNPAYNKYIFTNQTLLRGGNGGYWTNPADANLDGLRIDQPGRKGYFTLKTP
mgnify:FL=1